ncbi:hypothetical protein Dimus_010429, partial [Dionaea muscipula]
MVDAYEISELVDAGKLTAFSGAEDDDVPLNLKYQAPLQSLIPVDAEVEIVGVNPAEMKVDVNDNSLILIGEDGESYGIDDVDALIDIVIEDTTNKIFEDAYDKVDMELTEELVNELEEKEMDIVVKNLQTTVDSLRLIAPSLKTLTSSLLAKLTELSVENQSNNKVVEMKIQLSEDCV